MCGAWSLPIYTLGPLSGAMSGEFGWSHASILATVPFLAAGMTLGTPIIGWLADRFESRLLAPASTAAVGVCMLALSQLENDLAVFRALYFAIGFLGAGSGGLIYTRAIGVAFDKARGIALGIALCGTGVGSFFAPIFVQAVIGIAGWREAYLALAVLVLGLGTPISYFGLKGQSLTPGSGAPTSQAQQGGTLATAIRDPRFHILLFSIAVFGVFIGSLVVNLMPVMESMRFSTAHAALIASLIGVFTIVGRLVIGWLLDRAPPHYVAVGAFAIAAAGMAIFAFEGGTTIILAVIIIGFLTGAEFDLLSFMVLRYFGVARYGVVFGAIYTAYTAVAIGGPIFGAWLIETRGILSVFSAASVGFAAAACVAALLPLADRYATRRAATLR